METGTLKELNVKPGDVVEALSIGSVLFTYGNKYIIGEGMVILDDLGDWHSINQYEHEFRITSRATPTPDLTAISTPFGLLDESTQEALGAHGGPYERWFCEKWEDTEWPGGDGDYVYRVKSGPVIETETVKITNADGMPMAYATVTTYNGTPNWATLQVKLND